MNTTLFNVREYGAVGDGCTLTTAAIQKAIDACHTQGGGTVYFPPGTFYSGTLFLKSNVTLHLETGATLLGSQREKDYLTSTPKGGLGSGHLLYGENLENIALTGRGVIDGNGPSFWTSEMINAVVLKPKDYRPRSLILLKNCRNTLVRDITLRNSPCFTLWMMGCDIATIHGVRILNPRKGPNTDAIDIDCSSNIHVSDCHIEAGDDCIALKSDAGQLGRNQACENITVTNCTFSSTACAIRVGYEGDALIRNCVFSNIVITDTDIGIDIVSILPAPVPEIREGARIEGLMFNNIVMEGVNRPIFLWLGREREGDFKGCINNISISNVIAKTTNGCYIGGMEGRLLEGIDLSHIKLIMQGKMQTDKTVRPCVWGGDPTPWGIFAEHVQGLKLHDIEVDWRKASGLWLGGFKSEQVADLEVTNFKGQNFSSKNDLK
jgi:polygalacturonase